MENDDETSGPMIDDEIYANGVYGDDEKRSQPIISSKQLDIEAYASLYNGRTKIMRLFFIAARSQSNQAMELEALRMTYDEIKKGENTQLHKEVVQKIGGRLGPEYGMDVAWCDAVDRRAEQKKEKLENELNAYRTNLIKESIRIGYNDFGDFYYAHGQLGYAFKNYVRTCDYCTTSKHIVHMCMSSTLVSIEMGQFTYFLEIGSELGNHYNEVIAPQDVATYGGLCALATFDRMELKNKVIDNLNFRNFLELVPKLRELINDFYTSHYASCLDYLGNLKANLLLDIHLHDHIETLYGQIRHKALIQYTHPFVSIDLNMMANAFKTDVAGLEKKLEALITDNQVQARIDSHNKILYAQHADQRNATFQRVLQTGNEFDRDVKLMLVRSISKGDVKNFTWVVLTKEGGFLGPKEMSKPCMDCIFHFAAKFKGKVKKNKIMTKSYRVV
ncbi:unnamed protein product [Malus baccata var. baccata]